MPNEFPMMDPKDIWQSQRTESFAISTEELRRRAHRLQTRARLEALSRIMIGLILFVVFARTFAGVDKSFQRLGWGVLSVWALYGAYQAYKWIWPSKLRPDATAGASLAFYRSELERRRDYVHHIWRRAGLGWCFFGLAVVLLPAMVESIHHPHRALNAAPFLILLAIWFILFFSVGKRKKRKLQEEIEQLNALENENR